MSEIYSAILTATVLPSDCTDEVIWESDDTTIATVTPIANTNTATVTALKAGSCIITVTCGDYSDSCNVTVQSAGPIPATGTFYAVNFTQGQFTPNTSDSTATTWTADVQRYAVSDEFNVTPGYIVEFDTLGDPDDWNHTTVPALTIMFYSGSKTNPSSITDAKIVRYDGGGPRMWKADDYFSRTEYKFSGAGFLVPEGYDHARIIAYGYGSLSSDASNVDNTLIRMINGGIKWNMTSDRDTTPDGTASGVIQAAGGIGGSGTTNIFLASPGHMYRALTTSSAKIQMGTGADNPPISTTTYSDFYELSSGTSTFNAKPSDNNAEYLYVSHPSSKTLADVYRMVVRETGPIRLTEIDLGNNYYINTNYIPKTTTKVEIGASTTFGAWATLVGSNTFFKIIWQNASGTIGAELGTKVSKLTGLGAQIDEGIFIGDFPNGKLTVNGTSATAVTPTSTSTTYPLLVGTGYSSTGTIETPPATHNLQVQYLKIYESNELIMDFYPTEIDGVEGLYDTIGKQFYGKIQIGVPVTDLFNLASYMSVLSSESYFNSNIAITPSDYTTEPTLTVSPSGVVNVGSFNKSSNNQFRITPVANGDAIITSASNNGHSSTTVVHVEDAFTELEEVTTLRGDMTYTGGNWRCISNRDASHKTSVYKVEPNTTYTITFNKVSTVGPNFSCFIVGSTSNPRGYNWTLGNPTVHRDSTSPLTSADLVQTITTSSNEPYLLVNYMGDVTWTVTKVLAIYETAEGKWLRSGNWYSDANMNTDIYQVVPGAAYVISCDAYAKIECSECPGADHLNSNQLGLNNYTKKMVVTVNPGMYYLYVSHTATVPCTVVATSPILCTNMELSTEAVTMNVSTDYDVNVTLTPSDATQAIVINVNSSTSGLISVMRINNGVRIHAGANPGTATVTLICGSVSKTFTVTVVNNA